MKRLQEYLDEKFSPFGLLYEINIVDSAESGSSKPEASSAGGLYAFVKYYSAHSAAQAKKSLTGRLYVAGQHLKIRYSTRPAPEESQPLFYTKCHDVANQYLGFNGWFISIIMLKENEEHRKIKSGELQYYCGVKLEIREHGVSCEGYGVATTSFNSNAPETKSVAVCRAKKRAYQQAVQNAFGRVLLVVLPSGKVYAEVNSTVEDRVFCDEQLTVDNVLKVNEVEIDPGEEEEDPFSDTDIDAINLQLLEDLEDENS